MTVYLNSAYFCGLFYDMVKTLFTVAFLFIFNSTVFCQPNALPKVKSGKIIRHDQFPSRFVTARNIDVWLPEGYDHHAYIKTVPGFIYA